MDCTD